MKFRIIFSFVEKVTLVLLKLSRATNYSKIRNVTLFCELM